MLETVVKTIKDYDLIEPYDEIIVGVSGGPDSICLLHILNNIKINFNLNIFVVHINHMIRKEDSEKDAIFVKNFCESLDIQAYIDNIDVLEYSKKHKLSTEEAGRKVRYERFDYYLKLLGAKKIAVAHNKNDQAETIILNMLRGSGIDGLKGMHFKRNNIIRPLINIDRKAIENYCDIHNLSPRIDKSNLKNIYSRNKVRLNLIPYIDETFNVNIVNKLFDMACLLKEDQLLINKYIRNLFLECTLEKNEKFILLDNKKLKLLDAGEIKRIIRHAICELNGNITGIENIHIEGINKLIINGRTGTMLNLPNNLLVNKSYNIIKIYKSVDNNDRNFNPTELLVPGITEVSSKGFVIEAFIEKSNVDKIKNFIMPDDSLVQLFDYEKLNKTIIVRTRQNGDVFKPRGSNGTKKLKKYYIDLKVPRDIRGKDYLVAKENEIVWIIGSKINDNYKVTNETKCVLKLIFKNKIG